MVEAAEESLACQPAGQACVEDSNKGGVEEQGSEMTSQREAPEVKIQSSSRPTTSSSTAAESPPPSRGGAQRSTSSKFATLRAAFEKTGSATNGSLDHNVRKRLTSSSDLNVGKHRERNQEHATEIARLKDELEKERELRVAYEEKVTSLEEEMDDVSSKMLRQTEELAAAVGRITQLEQLEEARADDEGSEVGEEEGAAQQKNLGEDSTALRRQISELKRSISRSMRPTGQLTDTALRQEISLLQHEMQNWVVNNFRKVKSEASPIELCDKLHRIAEPEQVKHLRPLYEVFDASAKLAMYQATVAVYMMEVFGDRFLFGLRGQYDWAKRTRQAAETLPAALDAVTFNRWRAVTFSALTQSPALKEPIENAASGMAEMICITLNAVTEMEESETRLASLKTIVRRAILLAHQVRAQQAQYEFVLPRPEERFDAAAMDETGDDGEADSGRAVLCATFPALFKSADDEGTSLEPRKIVFRAKVLCRDGDEG